MKLVLKLLSPKIRTWLYERALHVPNDKAEGVVRVIRRSTNNPKFSVDDLRVVETILADYAATQISSIGENA